MNREWDKVLEQDAEFEPVSGASLAGIAALAFLILYVHFRSENGWIPILDSANLAIHEAGHPIAGLFSNRFMVYGGTLFQLLFPFIFAMHFRRRGQAPGTAAGAVWLGESLLNVSRYMADARAQVLPLVGGGEHDWTEIFSRWGALELDTRIAGFTRFIALVLIIGAVAWLFVCWKKERV